jgi:hypothetical protein
MKKPSSLAQQIKMAQQTFDSWPDSRKSNLRLEGSSMFQTCSSTEQVNQHPRETTQQKKKAIA